MNLAIVAHHYDRPTHTTGSHMGEDAAEDATEPERAEPVRPGDDAPRAMVDAEDFLAFTERLRAVHQRLDGARVSDERRARWQRRLLAITEAARGDLERAEEQLGRFESELARQLDG